MRGTNYKCRKSYGALDLNKIIMSFALLFLAGCGSGSGIGFPESPFWHSTASTQVKREHFSEKCEAFGYEPGSTAMQKCIERRWTQSENDVKREDSVVQSSGGDWLDNWERDYRDRINEVKVPCLVRPCSD